jgi:hypothetical protein
VSVRRRLFVHTSNYIIYNRYDNVPFNNVFDVHTVKLHLCELYLRFMIFIIDLGFYYVNT